MSTTESDEQDLTRKQRREQARAERKAMEEAEVAQAARRRRMSQLGVVVTAVVVAIVVILVATSGGGGSKSAPKSGSAEANSTIKTVESIVNGIPQSGNTLGASTAPVTLVYYGDLECPICKEFTLGALPSIIGQWVRTGKLRIEYRSLETATREKETFDTQQVAALAAGKQNKMWHFVELFYHEQGEEDSGYVTESYLENLARQVPGLDISKWTSDRNDPELASQVQTDAQTANANGFNGTPSFLIGRTGGAQKKLEYTSLKEPTSFNQAIEALLKG